MTPETKARRAARPKDQTITQYLKHSVLFQGVSDAGLRSFLPCCRLASVQKGDRVFKEGDPATALYIVGLGRVALEMRLDRPDGSVTPPTVVASEGPGDAFGWSALVEPHVFTLSAKAMQPSELVLIDGEAVQRLLTRPGRAGHVVMSNIVKLLARRLAQLREAFVYERSWLWRELRKQERA